MAYTVILPKSAKRPPYNCNKTTKALVKFATAPVGTILRNNRNKTSVTKYH